MPCFHHSLIIGKRLGNLWITEKLLNQIHADMGKVDMSTTSSDVQWIDCQVLVTRFPASKMSQNRVFNNLTV